MDITCAYYDVSELENPTLMAASLSELPWPERRKQVMRYHFGRDQRLCLGAGLLAADLLRRSGATDLTLGYSQHGKPYLVRHPNIHFNLSHSGTLAVCAVADIPVGVDVETVQYPGPEVARYCYQPAELAWLNDASDQAYAFTRLWVRKESYIKLTGAGLSREPRTFSVLPGHPMENGARFVEFDMPDALICVCTFEDKPVQLRKGRMQEG